MLLYDGSILFSESLDLCHDILNGIGSEFIGYITGGLTDILKPAADTGSEPVEMFTHASRKLGILGSNGIRKVSDVLLYGIGESIDPVAGFFRHDRDDHIKTLLHKLHLVTCLFHLYKYRTQIHSGLERDDEVDHGNTHHDGIRNRKLC